MIKHKNVIKKPDEYVREILDEGFHDFEDGDKIFKNVSPRGIDEFYDFLTDKYPNHEVVTSFIRQSPNGQEEPNFIHSDEMMGDLTAILYLNKKHPDEYGTTFYNDFEDVEYIHKAEYNGAMVFDSIRLHSRNIKENFGKGDSSRLIQVVFLNKKV